MKILAFDCATKTGWAVCDSLGDIMDSGVRDFKKRRGESNGMLFLKFNKWLDEIIELVVPDIISYELAHFRGGAATEICVGLQTRVQEKASKNNIPYLGITTSEVKKFATGIGNAGKELMIEKAWEYLGRKPIDDNEADAVHLARFTANEVGL